MEQKFKLVDGNVVFVGAMGQANLSNKEIVDMLNGFNSTCRDMEESIKYLLNSHSNPRYYENK